jgi:regulator of cell morphogenesis and NO signaling
MTINTTRTVGEIAVELPQSTRIFERMKTDYCCGGGIALGDACAAAGVNLDTLVQMLEASTTQKTNESLDLQQATLTELIAYILDKHHVYTKEEMARLEPLAAKVVSAHGANHSELLAVRDLMQQLFAELKPHMFKEEQILFPYVLELETAQTQKRPVPFAPFGTVNNPIRMMMMEHDTAGDLLRELRKVSADYRVPADACISYKTFYEALEAFEQDLHQHIHLENNLLFPKAAALEEHF